MGRVLLASVLALVVSVGALAQTTIPSTYEILEDDFEGTLENWQIAAGSTPAIGPTSGRSGSAGLEIAVSQAENHLIRGARRDLGRADEGYFTFWFNPNNVVFNDPGSGFVPGRSIQIASIQGPNFKNLVAIRFNRISGSFRAFIEWRDADDNAQWDDANDFSISNGWQEITIGFRKDEWVACWVDGVNRRSIQGLSHFEPHGSIVQIGKTLSNSLIDPSGTLLFDDVVSHLPRISDLWVDPGGDDSLDGTTPGTAFATISRASDLAGAGTTVHIQPGVYRETIVPAQGGLSGEPVLYMAESGPGTVVVRGSEPSSALSWTQLATDTIGLPSGVDPSDIWWTDLSSWGLVEAPRFLVGLDGSGAVQERFPLAREPDWQITTPYKPSEFWWIADGGSAMVNCDPTTDPDPDCDLPSRSTLDLIDVTNETEPTGIEPGNLTTLGNLTGATLVARDARLGHYQYRRGIASHNVGGGRITVDSPCVRASATDPGLGWGVQYYVENHPALFDTPGEWWFDEADGRLYFWPPTGVDPSTIDLEISRHNVAFELINSSYLTLQDLDAELYNDVIIDNRNFTWHNSVGNRLTGNSFRYGLSGIVIRQNVEPGIHADKRVEDYLIEDNHISHMDFNSINTAHFWTGGTADEWVRVGTFDLTIRGNEIHDIGFRTPDGANSPSNLVLQYADRVIVEDNWIHDTAHDGIIVQRSVIQSANSWGFSPSEIKTGQILIKDNVVERTCLMKNDCGALKIWGRAPDNHVFRDLLVVGNTLRDSFGWGWPAAERGILSQGQIPGTGAAGIYLDNGSGVYAFRNLAYNTGVAGVHGIKTWRDGPVYLYNNVLADSPYGIRLTGMAEDTHPGVDTRIRNNLVINNSAYGVVLQDQDGELANTFLDRNRYHNNGWEGTAFNAGLMQFNINWSIDYYETLAEVQTNTVYEEFGLAGDPMLLDYDFEDHDPFDGSTPDFRLESGSSSVDAGTSILPPALDDLLTLFGINDQRLGPRYDQGAFEGEVVCDDLTVQNQQISSPTTVQACDTLTLGPDLTVNAGATLTAIAGRTIVVVNGYEMATGSVLEATEGQFPP